MYILWNNIWPLWLSYSGQVSLKYYFFMESGAESTATPPSKIPTKSELLTPSIKEVTINLANGFYLVQIKTIRCWTEVGALRSPPATNSSGGVSKILAHGPICVGGVSKILRNSLIRGFNNSEADMSKFRLKHCFPRHQSVFFWTRASPIYRLLGMCFVY